MSAKPDVTVAKVRVNDVLVLSTPTSLRNDQKDAYLNWFRGSLVGTSLERCKVILLDGGAQVQVLSGDDIQGDGSTE